MVCLAADLLTSFPQIDGVVGNGCVVALALVCLIQYSFHVHYVMASRRRAERYQGQITDLSGELDDLQHDQVLMRIENRILRAFVSSSDFENAADLLLKYLVPNPSRGFAAVFYLDDSRLILECSRGLSKSSLQDLQLTLEDFPSLTANDVSILKERELRQSELWSRLSVEDRRKSQEVFLLPIASGGELIGVVLTTELCPLAATKKQQMELARRLMPCIGGTLKQSRALKHRENQLRFTGEMLQLRSLTDRIYATPLDMVQTYLSAVQSMVDADGATLFFPSGDEAVQWKPMVRCEADLALTLLPHWEEHEKRLLAQLNRASEFQTYDAQALKKLGIDTLMRAAMLVPLWQHQQVSGLFCFTRHGDEPFESSQRQLAHWAAQHLGKTLIRLQSIADIKRQAKQDGLTELANRRTFDEQIEREIRVAQRAGVECSLLLCDLDRFKTVNDTFGHPAGDEVLRILARMIHDIAQQTAAAERALTARYGGEEMAILLPGQGESVAVQVAETIRLAVADKIVWWQQMPINVTTSIGVATFPAHGQTAGALIASADAALYLAKASGRNCVCSASASHTSAAQ